MIIYILFFEKKVRFSFLWIDLSQQKDTFLSYFSHKHKIKLINMKLINNNDISL